MAELLADRLKTKYITDDYVYGMQKVLDSVDAIDIAYCKFGPSAESTLQKYYATVDVMDSKNPMRDTIVKRNTKAARMETLETELLPADYNSIEEVKKLLTSLDRTKVYRIYDKNIITGIKMKNLAIEILMQLPDVQLDLGMYAGSIFDMVRKDWLLCAEKHDAYWRVCGAAIIKVDCVNGVVQDLDGREIKEDVFIREYTVLPHSFGTERVIEQPEFKSAWLTVVKSFAALNGKERRMLDYIKQN